MDFPWVSSVLSWWLKWFVQTFLIIPALIVFFSVAVHLTAAYSFFLVFEYCFGNTNSMYKMEKKEASDDYLVFELLAILNIFCAFELQLFSLLQ